MKEDATDSKTREQTGHTPEPWLFDGQSLVVGETRHMLRADGVGWSQADAGRIVACVNACAGIANPSAVAGLIEALEKIRDLYGELVPNESRDRFLNDQVRQASRIAVHALTAFDSTVPEEE